MPDIADVLKAVAPRANPAFIKASSNAGAIMREFGITSKNAQVQLIAQTAHECAGYTQFQEGLSYSAQRLVQVWPSRFPSVAEAEPYARKPRDLANKVYNGRMGNRPGTDDGFNYRGSGPLQHTGRSEFERVERRTRLHVVAAPDMLRNPMNADAMWRAACSYFVDRGALPFANAGDTTAVTRKVNGGVIGLADRKILVQRADAAMLGVTITGGATTTVEDAEDAKRKAKNTTAAAPAGGGGSGSTSKVTGADYTTAIAIGVGVALIIGVLAVVYWRKHFAKKAEVETMRMKAIDDRIAIAT